MTNLFLDLLQGSATVHFKKGKNCMDDYISDLKLISLSIIILLLLLFFISYPVHSNSYWLPSVLPATFIANKILFFNFPSFCMCKHMGDFHIECPSYILFQFFIYLYPLIQTLTPCRFATR